MPSARGRGQLARSVAGPFRVTCFTAADLAPAVLGLVSQHNASTGACAPSPPRCASWTCDRTVELRPRGAAFVKASGFRWLSLMSVAPACSSGSASRLVPATAQWWSASTTRSTAAGRQDRGARHLPQTRLRASKKLTNFGKAERPALAVPDGDGADALGASVMGPARPQRASHGAPSVTPAPRGRRHEKLTDRARQLLLLDRALAARPARGRGGGTASSYRHRAAARLVGRRRRAWSRACASMPGCTSRHPRAGLAPGRRAGLSGARRRAWRSRLGDPTTPWRRVTIAGWYGGGERRLNVDLRHRWTWHGPGMRVPIRWLLVRDCRKAGGWSRQRCPVHRPGRPTGRPCWAGSCGGGGARRRSTRRAATSGWRRSGSGRNWPSLRTTPALLGLFSLVTLRAAENHARRWPAHSGPLPGIRSRAPTFSDALAAVSGGLVARGGFRHLRGPITRRARKPPPRACGTPSCYAAVPTPPDRAKSS